MRFGNPLYLYILCFTVLLGIWSLPGLLPSARAQTYQHRHLTESEGLPNSTVFAIAQDSTGLMYFATRSGISSFDGLHWQNYDATHGLSEENFHKLIVDSENRVWATTLNMKLYSLEGDTWVSHGQPEFWHEIPNDRIVVDCARRAGAGGDQIVFHTRFAVSVLDRNGWRTLAKPKGYEQEPFYSVEAYGDGFLFATSRGLLQLQDGNWKSMGGEDPLRGKRVYGLAVDPEDSDRIWFVTREEVGCLRDGKVLQSSSLEGYSFNPYKSGARMLAIGNNTLLFGWERSLFMLLRDGHVQSLSRSSGLLTEGANDLLLDQDRQVWIASHRGITQYFSFRFANFTRDHGLLADEVASIVQRPDSSIVFGHFRGISIYADHRVETIPIEPDGPDIPDELNRVMDMVVGPDGNTYIAASNAGFWRLDSENRLQRLPYDLDEYDSLNSLLLLDDRTILLGTGRYLAEYDITTGQLKTARPRVDTFIRRLVKESDGNVLIGSSFAGVIRWSRSSVQWFTTEEYPDANSVFNIQPDWKGRTLVGTVRGVFVLESQKLVPHGPVTADAKRPIYLFVKDNENLWVGTDNGVMVFGPQTIRMFTPSEGLAGRETNRAAGMVDFDGCVWIGTASGVSRYDPAFDHPRDPSPRPRFISFEMDTLLIPAGTEQINRKELQGITANYRAVSMLPREKVRYECILRNHSGVVVDSLVTTDRAVSFTMTRSGKYRIELRCKEWGAPWSEKVFSPLIEVQTVFYRTWYFRGAILALIVGLLVILWHYYTNWRNSKRLAIEIQSERSKLRDIIENTSAVLLDTDAKGVITYINPGSQIVLGYPVAESLGRHLLRFVHPEDRRWIMRIIREADGAESSTTQMQCRILHRNGEFIWFSISLRTVHQDGQFSGVSAIAQDISSQKTLEEQLQQSQKMEAVGLLAGGISHDFNNLLTAIHGNVELAKLMTESGDKRMRFLDEIEQATQRATTLTRQLLAFSRKQKLQLKVHDLNEIVRGMETMLRRLIGERVLLRVEYSESVPPILADRGQLEQVIINLAINARDAIDGEGEVLLRTSRHEGDSQAGVGSPAKPHASLRVRDNGMGMPPEVAERVFEPFFTTKESGRGTGLGLSTVYGIIKQFSGEILLESEVGVGTTFTILLPATEGEVEADRKGDGTEGLEQGSESVLVVEDEEAVRELTAQILGRLGYRVEMAPDGLQALELLKERHGEVDLILTDVVMPELTGPELLREVRARWPQVRSLYMSGYTTKHILKYGTELEDSPLLNKPFSMKDLAAKVREVLDA